MEYGCHVQRVGDTNLGWPPARGHAQVSVEWGPGGRTGFVWPAVRRLKAPPGLKSFCGPGPLALGSQLVLKSETNKVTP